MPATLPGFSDAMLLVMCHLGRNCAPHQQRVCYSTQLMPRWTPWKMRVCLSGRLDGRVKSRQASGVPRQNGRELTCLGRLELWGIRLLCNPKGLSIDMTREARGRKQALARYEELQSKSCFLCFCKVRPNTVRYRRQTAKTYLNTDSTHLCLTNQTSTTCVKEPAKNQPQTRRLQTGRRVKFPTQQ